MSIIAKNFTKRELVSILETIETIRKCSSGSELGEALKKTKELLEADYSVCGMGRVSPQGTLSSIIMVVNGDYPQSWLDIYRSEHLYEKDPIIRYNMRFCGTHLWSNIFRHYDDRESRIFLERAGDFGLKYGVTSGIYDPESRILSLFSFAGRKNTFKDRHRRIADLITLHLNQALSRVCRNFRAEYTAAST